MKLLLLYAIVFFLLVFPALAEENLCIIYCRDTIDCASYHAECITYAEGEDLPVCEEDCSNVGATGCVDPFGAEGGGPCSIGNFCACTPEFSDYAYFVAFAGALGIPALVYFRGRKKFL